MVEELPRRLGDQLGVGRPETAERGDVGMEERNQIKAAGDGGYNVQGTLTIKGKSKEVTVPAKFSEKDGGGVFEGKFTILRGDFGVGEGAWSAFDIVANEIQVEFRIAAKP